MKLKLTMIIFSSILFFTGCSKMVSIGYEQSYCEEYGKNYQDAGVCGDPMKIYKNRYYINENDIAYRKGCNKCK
jgi:hypothetical protein